MRKMPNIQQVAKAVPNIQQVCQAAEEQFHKVSRCTQQEGNARHWSRRQGSRRPMLVHNQTERTIRRRHVPVSRWTGQEVVTVKQLAGQETMPDSQAKGQDLRRTMPHSQQVERIQDSSECQAVPRQGRKRPKATNNQMQLLARVKHKPAK